MTPTSALWTAIYRDADVAEVMPPVAAAIIDIDHVHSTAAIVIRDPEAEPADAGTALARVVPLAELRIVPTAFANGEGIEPALVVAETIRALHDERGAAQ